MRRDLETDLRKEFNKYKEYKTKQKCQIRGRKEGHNGKGSKDKCNENVGPPEGEV